MKTFDNAITLLKNSIGNNDSYMLWTALFTLFLYVLALAFSREIKGQMERTETNIGKMLRWTERFYTLFLTTVSLFPLLGMLGTVWGLLNLDLSSGDMENVKANFFAALTSTAWGIIFSILFKLINAWVSDGIETTIEKARRLIEKGMTKEAEHKV